MSKYGQFCSVARTHELLGGRWTLLIVREMLFGGRRFNDIRRGVPRISKTVLSERLQLLVASGVVKRSDGPQGPEYNLTPAGKELSDLVATLAVWGQRWLPRHPDQEDLDLEPVLVDMQRNVRNDALPRDPLVARFELRGSKPRFMLLQREGSALCTHNPGFPEPVCVRGPLPALVGWWRGDTTYLEAQRVGLTVEGPRQLARSFSSWFSRYPFSGTSSQL